MSTASAVLCSAGNTEPPLEFASPFGQVWAKTMADRSVYVLNVAIHSAGALPLREKETDSESNARGVRAGAFAGVPIAFILAQRQPCRQRSSRPPAAPSPLVSNHGLPSTEMEYASVVGSSASGRPRQPR